jgi:hypothetical protein
MANLPVLTWIGNAAAVLCGPWGAVTRQAQQAGCSRQTAYDHARRVEQAVTNAHAGGPDRDALLRHHQELQEENRQLWAALEYACDFPTAKQRQFTATAAAMGLSLTQIGVLLALVLSSLGRVPSRAQLGRWVQQEARRAGRLLQVLDRASQTLVCTLCLDEIFLHRRPVLMGVEPSSLVWVLGQRTPDRTGETWAAALAPWTRVTYTAVDGGSGLRRGLELTRQQRQEAGPALPLAANLDNFHIQQDGQRALRRQWQEAEKIWVRAEQADRAVAEAGRQGQKLSGPTAKARAAWARAEQAFAAAQCREAALRRVVAALALFRPDGLLNDRDWATAEINAAVQELPGERWAKFCRMALDPRALTFLDRLPQALEAAEPRSALRQAVVVLWRLRHPQRLGQAPAARPAGRDPAREVVQALLCQKLASDWQAAYQRVSRVLRGTVRASSVVECLNSVLRMHQARHRGLSQDLIDLKRLYWNARSFAEGKRAGHCPYEHLGLRLPTYDWWELLQMDPDELEQKLSTAMVTP